MSVCPSLRCILSAKAAVVVNAPAIIQENRTVDNDKIFNMTFLLNRNNNYLKSLQWSINNSYTKGVTKCAPLLTSLNVGHECHLRLVVFNCDMNI